MDSFENNLFWRVTICQTWIVTMFLVVKCTTSPWISNLVFTGQPSWAYIDFILFVCFSFSGILETYKTVSVVPATQTKARLHQSLVSHTEAKLDAIDISLMCPLTRSRMSTPVRGRSCKHISCFDGEAYLQLMWDKQVEKWKCPVSWHQIVIIAFWWFMLEIIINNS